MRAVPRLGTRAPARDAQVVAVGQRALEAFFLAEGWGHDASVLLAEVATRTSRIRIGTVC